MVDRSGSVRLLEYWRVCAWFPPATRVH